jgi:hypothetical protein
MTVKKPAVSARVRLNRALAKHLIADFEANGSEVVAKIRASKPLDYVKLVSSVLSEESIDDAKFAPLYNVVERHIVRPENSDG